MPATEQAERLKRLQAVVRDQDIFWWADRFMHTLEG
jgi:trehalose-6-phosphate synthase